MWTHRRRRSYSRSNRRRNTVSRLGESESAMKLRIIETIDEDRKTINIWSVPRHISIDAVMQRQNRLQFRDLYLIYCIE